MIALDEERLVRGSRKWKIMVSFGIIFFFLLSSSVVFALMVATSLAGGYSQLQENGYLVSWLGITTAIFFVPLLMLLRYYNHLYHESVFEESSTGQYHKPTPTKCRLCGRHPVSKKYHLKKIHGIKDGTIGEYYENCGCKYCVSPIHMQGYG